MIIIDHFQSYHVQARLPEETAPPNVVLIVVVITATGTVVLGELVLIMLYAHPDVQKLNRGNFSHGILYYTFVLRSY